MSEQLDPPYFDPLSTDSLTKIVCRQFEEVEAWPLTDEIPRFTGSGLYAIYFTGSTELYRPVANTAVPLYVGKSLSQSSSAGRTTTAPRNLRQRIGDHQRSIRESDIDLADIVVRVLRMPDVHVGLGENGLIHGYAPIWNKYLKGFGSRVQGGKRNSAQSAWDTVHPGRTRPGSPSPYSAAKLKREVRKLVSAQASLDTMPWYKKP